jgi:hypothetical protein
MAYRGARIEFALKRPAEADQHALQHRKPLYQQPGDRNIPLAPLNGRHCDATRQELRPLCFSPMPDLVRNSHAVAIPEE